MATMAQQLQLTSPARPRVRSVYMVSRAEVSALWQTLHKIRLDVFFARALLVIPEEETKGIVWYATPRWRSQPLSWKRLQVEVNWQEFTLETLGFVESNDSAIDNLAHQAVRHIIATENTVSAQDEPILFCDELGRLLLRAEDDSATPLVERLSHVSLSTKQQSRNTGTCQTTSTDRGQVCTPELVKSEPITRVSGQSSIKKLITLPLNFFINFILDDKRKSVSAVAIEPSRKTPVMQFREGGDLFASSLETSGPQPFTNGEKRYDKVRVLLILWEEHDLPLGETKRVREAFESYNYEVEEFRIPKSEPSQALRRKIRASAADLKVDPDLNTLLIVFYYGHGGLRLRDGHDLILGSHQQGGTCVPWKHVAEAILQVRSDVLTVLQCCRAGASVLNEDLLRPFTASNKDYAKWVLTSSGFETVSYCGYQNSLACAIADILDRHLDTMNLDTERLHRQATFRAVDTHTIANPFNTTPGLLRMICGRPGTIALHPLRDHLEPRGKKRSRRLSSTDCDDEPPKTRAKAS